MCSNLILELVATKFMPSAWAAVVNDPCILATVRLAVRYRLWLTLVKLADSGLFYHFLFGLCLVSVTEKDVGHLQLQLRVHPFLSLALLDVTHGSQGPLVCLLTGTFIIMHVTL